MLLSNAIKIVGCLALLFRAHPLLAYGFAGTGSALYSPAKYGILTEYLPTNRLVLMGSGHSIAIQNFNENASILLMLGAYAMMLVAELPVKTIVVASGLLVSATMAWLTRKHGHDQD